MALIEFCEDFLQMDVLCVKRHFDYTLADRSLLHSKQIFIDERIHQIISEKELILVKGGRQLALVRLRESLDGVGCEVISKIQSTDWIQVAVMFENQLVGLVTAHNVYENWNLGTEKRLSVCSCEEKCILYSCSIVGESREELVVFAGTVFGDILIWSPKSQENFTLQTVTQAHNGAVFSIEVKTKNKILATTSDDRSLKIWSIMSEKPLQHPESWKNSTIHLVYTLFGHTSRVWRSLILENCYLTIGEDSQLIVWGVDGKVANSIILHQESGIRALDFSEGDCIVTTGGEDGGINSFPLKHLTTGSVSSRILNIGQSVSTKVCFVSNTDFVYTLNGSCFLVSSKNTQKILYKSENFSSYCVMEVSKESAYVALGSIKGDLVVIDSKSNVILTEERIIHGRIYSVHWLGRYLLTCGPDGGLDLWEFSSGVLSHTDRKTLPNTKERWTTCGAIQNEKLILGDRMGNLHVYKLKGDEIPVKTFRKIHSYLGVTDVYHHGNDWFSIGRDGTLKEYTEDLHAVTTRLPMEWPWKIVPHRADTLILGFHSVSFIIWSTHNREIIASHECGGGHRSCDFQIIENTLHFLYVKDKKVYRTELPLNGVTKLRYGFHGKEINCLKFLQTTPVIIITGSEDTTMRITKIHKSHLEPIHILKTHVSNVRALCTCPTKKGHLIVSAGGKGQIVVWEFETTTFKSREVVVHRLRKENSKISTPDVDPETRIMCVDITKLEHEYMIAAGCSDFQVRVFSLVDGCLNQLCSLPHTHCVLKLTFLYVDSIRVLVSMSTDGRVVFWNVTDFNPLRLESFPLHQSGINSFQFKEIGAGEFILATGGDDNSVCVSFVEISGGEVRLTRVWDTSTAHSCQITGIIITKRFLLTTSIDQRITAWKWLWHGGKFKAEYLNQCLTSVPDVQGMDAIWQNENSITVAVHGKGLELLRLDVNKENG